MKFAQVGQGDYFTHDMNLVLKGLIVAQGFVVDNAYLNYGFVLKYVPYYEIAEMSVKFTCFGLK